MKALHRELIAHEAGHAIVGLLSGLRVRQYMRRRRPTIRPTTRDAPAGHVEFERGDRRALALALLGGALAEGEPPPTWRIVPTTEDERMLASLVGENDELSDLEVVRDAQKIVESDDFTRMHSLASELLA